MNKAYNFLKLCNKKYTIVVQLFVFLGSVLHNFYTTCRHHIYNYDDISMGYYCSVENKLFCK